MQRVLSTYLFRQSVLGGHLLDQIVTAGFDQVELYCDRSHFDYNNPTHVREIAGWFADSRAKLHSVHAPVSRDPQETSHHAVISIAFVERQRRQESMDEIKRALELAEKVPFRYLIVHLGVPGEEHDLRKFDAALTSLEHLSLFAGQRGIEILVENIPNDLSSAGRLLEFFRHTHLPDLKVCFDVGHAQLEGNVAEALNLLQNRVAAVHLHDTGGARDDHRVPFEGMVPWKEVIPTLRNLVPQAAWVLEVRSEEPSKPKPESLARVFDRFAEIVSEPRK
jgi:sugar phosphate isomerase/epimerase